MTGRIVFYVQLLNCPLRKSLLPTPHLSRAVDRSSQGATLDIDTAEVPVLRSGSVVALAGETEDTKMPVGSVRRSAGGERTGRLDEVTGTSGVPEGNLSR